MASSDLHTSQLPKAPGDMTTQTQSTNSLLDFSAEIRNRTYKYALTGNELIKLPVNQPARVEPALLATCKQIRKETAAMFYANNSFESPGVEATEQFLKHIDTKALLIPYLRCMSPYDVGRIGTCFYFEQIRNWGDDILAVGGENSIRREALLFPIKKKQQIGWVSMAVLDDYVMGRIGITDEVLIVNPPGGTSLSGALSRQGGAGS